MPKGPLRVDVPNAPSVELAVPVPAIVDTILVDGVTFLILLEAYSHTYILPNESIAVPTGVLKVAIGVVVKGDEREARPSVVPLATLLPATVDMTSV
jgi:hypothetical protein